MGEDGNVDRLVDQKHRSLFSLTVQRSLCITAENTSLIQLPRFSHQLDATRKNSEDVCLFFLLYTIASSSWILDGTESAFDIVLRNIYHANLLALVAALDQTAAKPLKWI